MKELVFIIVTILCSASCGKQATIPQDAFLIQNCDSSEVWLLVDGWTNCDSANYQWNDYNQPAYGVPVQLQVWDLCGSQSNGWTWGDQKASVWLWSGESIKLFVKRGWCIVWGLEWFPNPCSAVMPDIGQSVKIAISADSLFETQVWPEGNHTLELWPVYYNNPPNDTQLYLYTGYHEASKIITKICQI